MCCIKSYQCNAVQNHISVVLYRAIAVCYTEPYRRALKNNIFVLYTHLYAIHYTLKCICAVQNHIWWSLYSQSNTVILSISMNANGFTWILKLQSFEHSLAFKKCLYFCLTEYTLLPLDWKKYFFSEEKLLGWENTIDLKLFLQ